MVILAMVVTMVIVALVSPLVSVLGRGVSTSCDLLRRAAPGKAYDRK